MSDSDLSAGSELFGYRVERLLGRGGMGVVYLCEDSRLRRRVALKVLTGSLAQDDGFRARFLAEAELAASLDHPHVVPIYEAGDEDGHLFIAMRYVEGSDLKALTRDGPLSPERALELCSQVADALDFAHEHGLVHGDVKPSNVLLDGRDHAYLADFGVTRRLEAPQAVEPGLLGTIDYVAPELIRGERLDGRADQYSLGCLLYECLTGEPPFARSTNAAVLFAHLEEQPPAPPGLEAVMATALAKDPADRYDTCMEVIAVAAKALGIGEHAEWGRRSTEWDRHGRNRGFLLTGAELDAAERWRREAAGKDPAPTVLHGEFIDASRQAVTRRLRRTRGYVSAALLVTIGLGVLAFVERQNAISQRQIAVLQRHIAVTQRQIAVSQRQIAVSSQHTAQSLALATSAEATLAEDPELSTLLALQALRARDTPQAEQALRNALAQLRILATLRPGGNLNSAAFNPDGQEIVTAGSDGAARIWSATTHHQLAVLNDRRGQRVWDAEFSPNGREIVTAGSDGAARIWNASSHQQLAVLREPGPPNSAALHTTGLYTALFSPDGKEIVTASQDGTARIWSASSHRQLAVLTEPRGRPYIALRSAAFSPDGRLIVTASQDATARIWDASSHQQLAVLSEPNLRSLVNGLDDAAFSPDGSLIVTAGNDGTARIWSASTRQQLAVLPDPGFNSFNSAAFSPDGTEIVTASTDGTARLWSTASGKQLLVLAGHTDAVRMAAFSPNGHTIVTASNDGTAKLWDVAPLERQVVLAQSGPIYDAEFSPDGQELVTASQDGNARIWSARNHHQLAILREPGDNTFNTLTSAVFSPNREQIVSASEDGTARIWSARSHKQLAVLSEPRNPTPGNALESAGFSPDGTQIVTASVDGTARIWSARSHQQLAVLRVPGDLNSAAFSPDGQEIVTASAAGTARIWSARSHQQLAVLREPGDSPLIGAAFSPNGKQIVTGGRSARIWNATDHQELAVLTAGGGNSVGIAAFSPDGKEIVTATSDGTVRIWSATRYQQLTVLGEPTGIGVSNVAFSPDGKEIVTANQDGTARIWSTELAGPIQALERIAEKRVTRQLTRDEKKRYNVP